MIRIGISGWLYPKWRGTFYPKGLKQREELKYAASKVNSIEVNGTFYSLKKPADFTAWCEQVPDDFLFSIKGPQFITHMKRLKAVEQAAANFFASGILRLNQRLGPILWQFPENFAFDRERFQSFLSLLPTDTQEAAELAKRHNEKLKAEPWLDIDKVRPMRHAFEIRHSSFLCADYLKLLRKHNVAFVVADEPDKSCYAEDVTADFVYVRLHGSTERYASRYSDEELAAWTEKIRAWHAGIQTKTANLIESKAPRRRKSRDVYVYCDNDAKVHAPFDAMRLANLVQDA